MTVTDLDEWLQPGSASDEVAVEVGDDRAGGVTLRASMTVTPAGRTVHLVAVLDGIQARHDADEAGPPSSNWDRMRIGSVEWRMVEPLHRWELSVEEPTAGLRAYLAFSGSSPCTPLPDGYEQVGTVSGQLQLAERRVTVTDVPARRSHTWR